MGEQLWDMRGAAEKQVDQRSAMQNPHFNVYTPPSTRARTGMLVLKCLQSASQDRIQTPPSFPFLPTHRNNRERQFGSSKLSNSSRLSMTPAAAGAGGGNWAPAPPNSDV